MDSIKTFIQWQVKTKGKRRPGKHPQSAPLAKQQERAYVRQLLPILHKMSEEIRHRLIRRLPDMIKQYNQLRPTKQRLDAVDDDIRDAMKSIRLAVTTEFDEAALKRIAEERGITIARLNKQFAERGVKSVLGIDIYSAEPYVAEHIGFFATGNVNLITSMEDEFFGKVENLAMQGLTDGLRAEEIADKIEALIDPEVGNVRARAELIARDQVSKLNGQLTEMRQTELGVTRYVWRTTGDERVRDYHRDLNGEIFSWDDPPITNYKGDRNHPGGDFQCRCWAEPILSDLIEGLGEDQDE